MCDRGGELLRGERLLTSSSPVYRRSTTSWTRGTATESPTAGDRDSPRPLNSTGRQGYFLNSTCDIEVIDMRHGFKKCSDMGHGYFLNSTCYMDMYETTKGFRTKPNIWRVGVGGRGGVGGGGVIQPKIREFQITIIFPNRIVLDCHLSLISLV